MAKVNEIFVVEPAQKRELSRAISASGWGVEPTSFESVKDLKEKVLQIARGGSDSSAPKCLIFVDLDGSGVDLDSLFEIKDEPNLKRIPIICFSSGTDAAVISRCYDHGVNSILSKPVTGEALAERLAIVHSYWFDFVELPTSR